MSTDRDDSRDEIDSDSDIDDDDDLDDEIDDELDEYDDEYDEDDEGYDDEDDLDEVAPDGNRIVGARPRAVVEYVTRRVAEDADAIEVEMEERGEHVTLLVHANPSDMGRLIGKRGRVIQALRRVTRAAGAAEGVKANVDIAE